MQTSGDQRREIANAHSVVIPGAQLRAGGMTREVAP